jgi:condensin complex subunit 2
LTALFNAAEADASTKQSAKKPREKKEAFKLDFLTPAEKDFKELTKELFAPVTKGAGINLPGTGPTARKNKKKEKEKDDHSLPDDMHFSSRQLVSLFLKPKFQVCFLFVFTVQRGADRITVAQDAGT